MVLYGEGLDPDVVSGAVREMRLADTLIVGGTSLAVYPAASLVRCLPPAAPIWLVDPGRPDTAGIRNPLTVIRKRAAEGVPELVGELRRGMRG